MGLKSDLEELMGSLFGKDIKEIFEWFYDENNPEEMLKASDEMLSKLLGRRAAHTHLRKILKKYPKLGWYERTWEN